MRTGLVLGIVMLAASIPAASAQTVSGGPLGNARPSARQDDPPYHFRDGRTEIFIKSGSNLTVEPGVTDLHPPKTVECRSVNGCKVAIAVSIAITSSTGAGYTICSLVDGVAAKPSCAPHGDIAAATLQNAKVAQGPHVFQTQFTDNGGEGVIGAWQVNYTLYENR